MFRTLAAAWVVMLVCLPSAAWSRSPEVAPDRPVTLAIDARGRMTLDGRPTSRQALMTVLSRVTAGDHDRAILIQPNTDVRYGELEALIQRIAEAGYTRVALNPAGAANAARR